jgi:hypothetical protein
MEEFRFVDDDGIRPTEIEHRSEEMFDGDTLSQKYNYLVYHFRCDGAYFWARSYVESIDTVSVYGPFAGRDDTTPVPGPVSEAVLAYLQRRFKRIERPARAGEGEGYVLLWSAEENGKS